MPTRLSGHKDYVLTGANGEVIFINICAQVQNDRMRIFSKPDPRTRFRIYPCRVAGILTPSVAMLTLN
jgi:hypothetical protein